MIRTFRVEICGGIASGKTTLARILARGAMTAIFERFRSNPFWKDFCADRHSYSFETELTFLLLHYHSVKDRREEPVKACDFSFLQDLTYANINLRTSQREVFQELYDEILEELGPPRVLIYLQCSPSIELKRIKYRGRPEGRRLNVDDIQEIDDNLLHLVSSVREPTRVLTIDSEHLNFATRKACQKKVHCGCNGYVQSIRTLAGSMGCSMYKSAAFNHGWTLIGVLLTEISALLLRTALVWIDRLALFVLIVGSSRLQGCRATHSFQFLGGFGFALWICWEVGEGFRAYLADLRRRRMPS
jgi:deoxyadenosine/deoxycytidine kinase